MRRKTTRILLPAVLSFLQLIGVSAIARGQNGTPMHLTLPEAIDLALKQNRDLKLARLAVTDSQYKKEIAHSAYFPQISNQSTALHLTELEGVVFPAGTFGAPAATGPIPGQTLTIDQGALDVYTSGTGLAQPLTQMFKIRESNRAATADINTAKIQVTQAENEIALKVRQLYCGILIAQLKLQAAAEEVSSSQVKAEESASDVERGRALEVAALESRASLLDARQTALTEKLQVHDLTVTLDDLLGLPLSTELDLEANPSATSVSVPSREECIRTARENNPEVRAAEQAVVKAKAGLAAAKDAYIPDLTGLARYSYQSGVPFLVHNFGTFGVSFTYDLFDGGKREAQIKDSRTLLSEAELNLTRVEEQVAVQVETAYDKVEQLQDLVGVAEEALEVRTEAARLADRRFEQNAALPSDRAEAHAKEISAKASSLQASLGLSLAQSDLIRTIGEMPR
ncbi:MAG TPA: TolC family protein [Silvibacterium sp.]|jgi:outer membrane protein TolC|nr:TolC family protein [Silvibacterium sp.]